MLFSVVMPVYNRLDNAKLAIKALRYQENAPDFELIIVDDGSTDGLREWFDSKFKGSIKLKDGRKMKIKYIYGGPNKGFRGGRARNLGAFNSNPLSSRFVFVDSDIVLNKQALFRYAEAHAVLPGAVIVGQYHWLAPMDWRVDNMEALASYTGTPDTVSRDLNVRLISRPNEGLYGIDLRAKDFTDSFSPVKKSGLGAFSGNISYPRDLFMQIGGFDEAIVGHGGEDADLGLTADERDADWLFYKPIFGWHVWHDRNQSKNIQEVQKNIVYIDQKHGIGKYADAKKWTDARDSSDVQHYKKEMGAAVYTVRGMPGVFAVRENMMAALPDQQTLEDLGFTLQDIKPIDLPVPPSTQMGTRAPTPADMLSIYFKQSGGRLVKSSSNPTVYAVNEGKRIGLRSPEWVSLLGFKADDIQTIQESELAGLIDDGATPFVPTR